MPVHFQRVNGALIGRCIKILPFDRSIYYVLSNYCEGCLHGVLHCAELLVYIYHRRLEPHWSNFCSYDTLHNLFWVFVKRKYYYAFRKIFSQTIEFAETWCSETTKSTKVWSAIFGTLREASMYRRTAAASAISPLYTACSILLTTTGGSTAGNILQ